MSLSVSCTIRDEEQQAEQHAPERACERANARQVTIAASWMVVSCC